MTITLKKSIKVLIVDDSAVVRKILSHQLNMFHGIKVVGTAPDPYVARNKIIALGPDVLTLDIEMPRMDGITFLKKLMKHHPMPVIVLSALTPSSGKLALEALAAGAIDVMLKPGPAYSVGQACEALHEKIKNISKAQIDKQAISKSQSDIPPEKLSMTDATDRIFAIGASTGGVQALTYTLSALPANAPGTLVVQHMPPQFITSFAERLNQSCTVYVSEAKDRDQVIPGRVLIAPGNRHMLLERTKTNYYVRIKDGPPVCRQRPSIDVLFNSVATYAGPNAVGAILTGMGKDGADGLLNMRQNGAHTIAQDRATSIIFGMPKEAIELGAAEKIIPLPDIARTLINFTRYR